MQKILAFSEFYNSNWKKMGFRNIQEKLEKSNFLLSTLILCTSSRKNKNTVSTRRLMCPEHMRQAYISPWSCLLMSLTNTKIECLPQECYTKYVIGHGPLLLDRLVCKRGSLCGLDSLVKWYLYSLSNFVKL